MVRVVSCVAARYSRITQGSHPGRIAGRRGRTWIEWQIENSLSRLNNAHNLIGLDLDFVPRWEEGVEADNEVRMALE